MTGVLLPSVPMATKVKKAVATTRLRPEKGSSLVTPTPISMLVRNALFTCATTATTAPAETSASNCKSSMLIVTLLRPQCRSAAMHAVASMYFSSSPGCSRPPSSH